MGTPHRDSDWANLGRTVGNLAKVVGFSVSKNLTDNLRGNSEILGRLREGFRRTLDEGAFFVTSCQEGKGFTRVGLLSLDTKVCLRIIFETK